MRHFGEYMSDHQPRFSSRDIEESYNHIKEFYISYKSNGTIWFEPERFECFLGFLKLKYKNDELKSEFLNSFLSLGPRTGDRFIPSGKVQRLLVLYDLEIKNPNLNKELIRAVNQLTAM